MCISVHHCEARSGHCYIQMPRMATWSSRATRNSVQRVHSGTTGRCGWRGPQTAQVVRAGLLSIYAQSVYSWCTMPRGISQISLGQSRLYLEQSCGVLSRVWRGRATASGSDLMNGVHQCYCMYDQHRPERAVLNYYSQLRDVLAQRCASLEMRQLRDALAQRCVSLEMRQLRDALAQRCASLRLLQLRVHILELHYLRVALPQSCITLELHYLRVHYLRRCTTLEMHQRRVALLQICTILELYSVESRQSRVAQLRDSQLRAVRSRDALAQRC